MTKISDLTAASAALGTEQIPYRLAGTNGRLTSQQIADLVPTQQSVINVMDYPYLAVGDGVTDCTAAIQAAIQAAYDRSLSAPTIGIGKGSGAVTLPQGIYRITAPLNLLKGVNLIGFGSTTSVILADNCDAVTPNAISGFGQQTVSGICFVGQNATAARTAIKRVSTLDLADMLYGLNIEACLFYNFDTAIRLRSLQQFTILNCWGQNLNQAIVASGFTVNGVIENSNFIKATGGGVGGTTFTGLELSTFNYTLSGGVIGPEGITVKKTQFFKFSNGFDIQKSIYFTSDSCNIVATVYGVKIGDARDGTTIRDAEIEMQSVTAVAGIYLASQASLLSTITVIHGNNINGTNGATSVSGILVNEPGTLYQANVSIKDNLIKNMKGYDIAHYSPVGGNTIVDNICASTGNTGSILVTARQSGITTIVHNYCANSIAVSVATDLTNGYIVITPDNIQNGSAIMPSSLYATLAATQTLTNKTLTAPVINSPTGIVRGDVGLGNVDNTSDATKNAATKTLTNTTLDSAGTGNVLKVSGVTVSAGQYPGATATGSATAGNVGEYVEGILASGSATSLVTATAKTVTSIDLTAGDWEVDGVVNFNFGAATSATLNQASLSQTTNTVDSAPGRETTMLYNGVVPGGGHVSQPIPNYRFSLSATTTIYLVANSTFTAGTLTAYGIIRARRAR